MVGVGLVTEVWRCGSVRRPEQLTSPPGASVFPSVKWGGGGCEK